MEIAVLILEIELEFEILEGLDQGGDSVAPNVPHHIPKREDMSTWSVSQRDQHGPYYTVQQIRLFFASVNSPNWMH